MEASLHVRRHWTDEVRQDHFRDASVTSRVDDDRRYPRENDVVLRGMANRVRDDEPIRLRGGLAESVVVRSGDEEPHRNRRSDGGIGRWGHELVHQKESLQEYVRPLPRAEPVPYKTSRVVPSV